VRRVVKLTAAWSAACAVLVALPAPDSRADQEGRWVPSLALSGGATIQPQDSSVESSCELGGPGDSDLGIVPCDFLVGTGPAALRPYESETDWAVSPFVGANLQLMTPAIQVIPGRPRFFLLGEIQLLFPPTRDIAKEGDPSSVRLPDTRTELQATPALTLNGVGSSTTSEIQTLSWGAGVGVAFPFGFRGRRLWLKPSAAWTRYEIDVEGVVVAGLKDDPVPGTYPRSELGPPDPLIQPTTDWPFWGSQVREVNLSGSGSKTYDGIGPGLELEMIAGRFGQIGVSLFVNANAYRILGDREVAFSARDDTLPALPYVWAPSDPGPPRVSEIPGNPNGLPADTYTASWSFEVDPWLFRAGVGVRFHWFGP
jgi:hypothetical protein